MVLCFSAQADPTQTLLSYFNRALLQLLRVQLHCLNRKAQAEQAACQLAEERDALPKEGCPWQRFPPLRHTGTLITLHLSSGSSAGIPYGFQMLSDFISLPDLEYCKRRYVQLFDKINVLHVLRVYA